MPTVAESNADLNAGIALDRARTQVQANTVPPVPGKVQKVLEYTLRVRGIWGRKRKSDSRTFTIAKDQGSPLNDDTLLTLRDAALAKLKVKKADCCVYRQQLDLGADAYEGGVIMVSRSFMVFSGQALQTFDVVDGKVENVVNATHAEAL